MKTINITTTEVKVIDAAMGGEVVFPFQGMQVCLRPQTYALRAF